VAKLLWFLAGAGAGTLAGVLYAPQSGDETRQALRSKAQQGREKIAEQTQRVRAQANELVDRGREVLNEQKENLRNAYETGRQAYQEATTPTTKPKTINNQSFGLDNPVAPGKTAQFEFIAPPELRGNTGKFYSPVGDDRKRGFEGRVTLLSEAEGG
jgi:gas vesicle protein